MKSLILICRNSRLLFSRISMLRTSSIINVISNRQVQSNYPKIPQEMKRPPKLKIRSKEPINEVFSEDDSDYEDKLDQFDLNEEEESVIEDKSATEVYYPRPGEGHRVFLIQPSIRYGPRRKTNTTAQLQMDEAISLVQTLHDWTVIDKTIINVKQPANKLFFGVGQLAELVDRVQECPSPVSAVFIGVDILSGLQHTSLAEAFGVDVYDRYTVVLQIFNEHAKTKEAKLQIALAEIPYIKSRLRGMHEKGTGNEGKVARHIGGMHGETYIQTRRQLLRDREKKLRNAIEKLKHQREMLRKRRKRQNLPTVAVIGYTNAGKTSLIKELTGEKEMQPKDQLFATLDVTSHGGTLPSRMKTIFVDTVGFISDIPTHLISSFAATLEDAVQADVLVHIRDLSHPDTVAQKDTVIKTLKRLQLPKKLLNNLIEVGNKIDLQKDADVTVRTARDNKIDYANVNDFYKDDPENEVESVENENDCVRVSCKTGIGLDELRDLIEARLIDATGCMSKTFRVSNGGEEYRWLHANVTVKLEEPDPYDEQLMLMNTLVTSAQYRQFKSYFGFDLELTYLENQSELQAK